MPEYRKKPVVIEARKLTYENVDEIAAWCGGFVTIPTGITLETLEGAMHASMGDWVIRGVQGEFYPCKPDIFEQTYEDAESSIDDERHAGYKQLHELVKDAPEGVRRSVGNDPQRVLANGSFALAPTTLLHLLTRAYEQGRRQGPITDAQVEAALDTWEESNEYYPAEGMRAALEAARDS